jgi:hypothetical protein
MYRRQLEEGRRTHLCQALLPIFFEGGKRKPPSQLYRLILLLPFARFATDRFLSWKSVEALRSYWLIL